MKLPNLIVCDTAGNALEIPELRMAVLSGGALHCPDDAGLTPLPPSGVLFSMPGRTPAGFDPVTRKFIFINEYCGTPVVAAAAFMPPGYMQTWHTACTPSPGAPRLPLYCYAAVGWKNGRFYAAGHRIDRQSRHEIPDESLDAIDR
ncbi:MAG: hypothetical protein JXA71_20145, partial [Chitinispirillaceae bacterium]|nr:hypothetical protein [Chitinispirillaceae bacterium]